MNVSLRFVVALSAISFPLAAQQQPGAATDTAVARVTVSLQAS